MKRHFLLPIAAAMSAMIFVPSCSKDDNTEPEPNKEEPNLPNENIIKSTVSRTVKCTEE